MKVVGTILMGVAAGVVGLAQGRLGSERELQANGHYVLEAGRFDFLAGQHTNIGTVCAALESGDVTITFSTTNGWVMDETHLWYSQTLGLMPQTNKGSPQIGKFPYKEAGPLTTWTHTFSLESVGFSEPCVPSDDLEALYIAAHAATSLVGPDGTSIQQSETAWSNGDLFVAKGMWGTFSSAMFRCVEPLGPVDPPPPGPESSCETSFIRFDTDLDTTQCFLDLDTDGDNDGDFNRWGWTNGPYGPGTYEFTIYAGAGQCITKEERKVGTAMLVYDGTSATVSFIAKSGFLMDESQLYVGNEVLPRDVNTQFTVAPGQYPWQQEYGPAAPTSTYTVNDLSGDVYIVFHQVTCGPFQE